jgi:hypothetical protein
MRRRIAAAAINTHTCMHACICTCNYIRTYVHAYIRTYVCAACYSQQDTHVCASRRVWGLGFRIMV